MHALTFKENLIFQIGLAGVQTTTFRNLCTYLTVNYLYFSCVELTMPGLLLQNWGEGTGAVRPFCFCGIEGRLDFWPPLPTILML